MKIAVASTGNTVAEHFGHCPNFTVYEIDGGKIITRKSIPNPGHRPGFLPNFLGDLGVAVIISGGMGGGAVDIFNERNIEVVTGARGDAEAAVLGYLNGTLKSSGSICHAHEFEGDCGK